VASWVFIAVAVLLPILIGAATYKAGIPGGVLVALIPIGYVLIRSGRDDAVTFLTLFVVLLTLVPATQVFMPLKSVGSPATLLGILAAWLWALGRVLPRLGLDRGRQPVRVLVLIWAGLNVASFVAAHLRPIDALEKSAADRGVVLTFSMLGIALLAADGIPSLERLDRLLRRVVMAATVMAGIGLVQFMDGYNAAELIHIPGLGQLDVATFGELRSNFNRVAATATHAIEFSVVLCVVLPLALHYAFTATGPRRRWWWASAGLIAVGIPLSVSRSGFVALVVIGLVLVPSWPPRRRLQAVFGGIAYLGAMRVIFPGLLGTIQALFLHAGDDPSIQSREVDYGFVNKFFHQSPLIGRGFGTFLPSKYDFLDNQYLMALVEVGVLGVIAYLALWIGGIILARTVRRSSHNEEVRDLSQSLIACLAVVIVTSGTFDFLSFSVVRGLAFLLLGCIGALWRLQRSLPDAAALEQLDRSTSAGALS
jgi:hypothetical protein